MLISHSPANYLLIRLAVLGLRSIAPLSLIYSVYWIISSFDFVPFDRRLPLPLEVWLAAESAFLVFAYLPLRIWLQNDAVHPPPPSELERVLLFRRCLDRIDDIEAFLSAWFLGSPLQDIRRENVNEFYAWSLMNKRYDEVSDEELLELNQFTDLLEEKLGFPFGAGRGKAKSLRGTLDSVPMQHRPLVWYLIVFVVDSISSFRLLYHSFTFHPPGCVRSLAVFPPRLPHLLRWTRYKASHTSYWYREHTSKTKLPIVFVHGINIGLYAYVNFLEQLASSSVGGDDTDAGEVGIIAVELLSIGSFICPPLPRASMLRAEIQQILATHGWTDFVLVGHSFGTAVAANMIKDPKFDGRIKAALLMDPICFLLHLPNIAFNFTRRLPSRANELMLHYFSSQDMLISHTLARRFFWSDHTIWKYDIELLPVTVILSGQDLIVPARAVWNYLTTTAPDVEPASSGSDERIPSSDAGSGTAEWTNGNLRVLWFNAFDHAGLFASKGARRAAARIALQYSQGVSDAATT